MINYLANIMSEKKTIFSGSKEYLEKSFLEELNYKIWSTKGARFEADKRLGRKFKLSNLTFSILSAYLIIASLISVYRLNENFNANLLAYVITALSIMVLVLSQYDTSQNYQLRAKEFHNCALELSILYNKLRIFKTLSESNTLEETQKFCNELSSQYQEILSKYENHNSIDYLTFRITHLDYFTELSKWDVFVVKFKSFISLYGFYLTIILLPLIVLLLIFSS